MLNDVAAVAPGAFYCTETLPVGDIPCGILMVQPVIRCEHGYEVAVFAEDGELLARACLTGSQLMMLVHFPTDVSAVSVCVENITGCEEHPHTYEISLVADEEYPYAA
jgi:hypothetical protein